MYTVKNNKKIEQIIKKSKFITYIFKIDKEEEIESNIDKLKNEYKDSTHCTYAYILNQNIKAYDDHEPSGTAGIPILEVLKKNNLDHVLCVVIRYFGGIKLGSGGLIRAYSSSARLVVDNNIIECEEGYLVIINTSYDKEKEIMYLLKNKDIVDKDYKESINIKVKLNKKDLELLKDNNINYKVIDNVYIIKSSV